MNIHFHNLGKIKETELELKPMTVIIGPNNSNKTYIAYSIYGLWQTIMEADLRVSDFPFQLAASGSLSIKLEALQKAFEQEIRDDITIFSSELEGFYQDSSGSLFSRTRYEIMMSQQEFRALLEPLSGTSLSLYGKGDIQISLEESSLVLSLPEKTVHSISNSQGFYSHDTWRFDASIALNISLRRHLFGHPYLLPAERNAFVITYKVLAKNRLKLMLDAQRRLFSSRETSKRQIDLLKEAGEIRYPQPIEDFLELLFDIESGIGSASIKNSEAVDHQDQNWSIHSGIGKLAGKVEQNIQNGNKINFRATALGGQEIMVDVGNGLNIDLYNASSSIKQLAPLLLYLRYRAAKGDLLIIDEPEMNLHPESQAKLLEVLAMLVNQGVYVLLTTHSPYILSHLNNLAQTEEVSAAAKKRQAKSLYLNDPAALLNMDQISAYEMRDNQLHSLKDPDYGIRWDTLSDVSGELQQKFFQIYEEGQTPERAKTTRKPAKTPSK
jgi:hypothetical protein